MDNYVDSQLVKDWPTLTNLEPVLQFVKLNLVSATFLIFVNILYSLINPLYQDLWFHVPYTPKCLSFKTILILSGRCMWKNYNCRNLSCKRDFMENVHDIKVPIFFEQNLNILTDALHTVVNYWVIGSLWGSYLQMTFIAAWHHYMCISAEIMIKHPK